VRGFMRQGTQASPGWSVTCGGVNDGCVEGKDICVLVIRNAMQKASIIRLYSSHPMIVAHGVPAAVLSYIHTAIMMPLHALCL
jgi:hypothetical protein